MLLLTLRTAANFYCTATLFPDATKKHPNTELSVQHDASDIEDLTIARLYADPVADSALCLPTLLPTLLCAAQTLALSSHYAITPTPLFTNWHLLILLLLIWVPVARYWSMRWTPQGSCPTVVLSNYSSRSPQFSPGDMWAIIANSSSSILAVATRGSCFSFLPFFLRGNYVA